LSKTFEVDDAPSVGIEPESKTPAVARFTIHVLPTLAAPTSTTLTSVGQEGRVELISFPRDVFRK
jgi:hypothetical protein